MMIETITKLVCIKNKVSYIIFDEFYKIIEFNDLVINIADDPSKLAISSDIRDVMWEFIGLEERMKMLFSGQEEIGSVIHFPMLLKNSHYYDLDIEIFTPQEGKTLFIAYIIQKPKESLSYINMIQEINKRTLVYESDNNKQSERHCELINQRLLSFNVDMDGYITLINNAFTCFFDISTEDIIGEHFSVFFKARDLNLNGNSSIIFNAINQINEVISFHANIIPMGEGSEVYENIIICQDITYLKQIEKELEHASVHDSLTGLPNRSQLLKKIDESIQKSKDNDSLFALCFIDIDKFKPINDNYGHHAGDMLLKHVAKLFLYAVRKNDTVARIGGDEFVILFDNIKSKAVIQDKIDKIKKIATKMPLTYTKNDVIAFELSLGVSYYPEDTTDIQELFKIADKAMYMDKKVLND